MENKTDDICRICLKVEDTDFLPLNEYRISKLKVIIPQLNVDVKESSRFMICIKCKDALDEANNVRRTILDNQELIRSRKSKLGISIKVNLDRIFNENEAEWSHNTICRVCLNLSKDKSIFIDSLPPDDPFQDVLHTCLTILDRDLIANPLICSQCVDKLLDTFSFISSALTVDAKIREYHETNPDTKGLLENQTLHQVLNMLKENGEKDEETNNDFLSEFEVQDEEGNDIFDSIPVDAPANYAEQMGNNVDKAQWNSDYEVNRKRSSDAPWEAHPPKHPRLDVPRKHVDLPPPLDDLPHFRFTLNLMLNSSNEITLRDWLDIVEMQKQKMNWSDNMTIQKVLFRLQALPDLHPWFNSMGDILGWEDWKSKLLMAFPNPDDYAINLKRAINRRRRLNETYVDYFKDKVALLEKLNVTGEKAVSCIISSLTTSDLIVAAMARIGNYQSPEEMLEFFTRYDEKEAVMAKRDQVPPSQTPEKPQGTNPAAGTPQTKGGQAGPISKKKMKQKCQKCLQMGHLAINCKNGVKKRPLFRSGSGQSRVQSRGPQPKMAPAGKKKKKVPIPVCQYCGKTGHKTSQCPYPKLEELKNRQSQPQQPVCAHCGDTGHVAFNCPRPKKVEGGPPSALSEAKKSMKCGYCLRMGHNSDMCHVANRKAGKNAKRDGSQEMKRPQEGPCSFCGSTKHASRYCGRAPRLNSAPPKSPERRNSQGRQPRPAHGPVAPPPRQQGAQREERRQENRSPMKYPQGGYDPQGYRTMLCFRCYKLGHRTETCPRTVGYRR